MPGQVSKRHDKIRGSRKEHEWRSLAMFSILALLSLTSCQELLSAASVGTWTGEDAWKQS
eukprot:935345-Amphidinium_carterae.1